MSTESVLWDYLRDHVKDPYLDWVRVENSVGPGTPDVNFVCRKIEGWIELKYRIDWPRPTTALFDKRGIRPEQRIWINRRVQSGGLVWIVAGVDKDIFFIPGVHADGFNSFDRETMINVSCGWFSRGRFDPDSFLSFLSRKPKWL